VAIGEKPLLAGRSKDRLSELASSLGGLDTAVADVATPKSVRDLVEEGDVLISTVGPFTLYGQVALDAAVDAGAHYLDSTGEPAFIRTVFAQSGPVAERKEITLLTAFGVDWVPGNVAAAAAVTRAGTAARRVDVIYLIAPATRAVGRTASETSGQVGKVKRGPVISTGTRASLLAAGAAPQHRRSGGRLVLEPAAARMQSFTVDHKTKWGMSVGGSESLALPRSYPELDEVNVYMESPGPPRIVRGAVFGFSTAVGAIARTGPGRRLMDNAVSAAARRTGGGPSPEERTKSSTQVIAVCRDSAGLPIAGVCLGGPVNGYTLTGRTLAWGAAALKAGRQLASGAVGPVEAFGLEACLEALSSAGLDATDLVT